MRSASILIVQNDETEAARLKIRLKGLGYTACTAVSCGRQAVEEAAGTRPDVVLIDLGLEGELSGIDVANHFGAHLDVPVIYLTSDTEGHLLQRADTTEPYGYVLWPADDRQLHLIMRTALALHEKETALRKNAGELERTNDELRRRTRSLDAIVDHMREGVAVADEAGRLVLVSEKAEQVIGSVAKPDVESGDLPEASEWSRGWGVFEPDRETPVSADALPFPRALQGMATDDKEVFVRNEKRPHGAYVKLVGRTLRDKDARAIQGAIVFFRDISLVRKAATRWEGALEQLRDQGRVMGTLFDSMGDGLIIADTTGQHMLSNRSARQFLNLEPEWPDPGPETWAERYGLFCPDQQTYLPIHQNPLVRAMQGETVSDMEVFVRNSGAPQGRHMLANARALLNEAGEIKAGVLIFRDVTKERKAEAELQETVSRLRNQTQLMQTVFEGMSEGVVAVDQNGKRLFCNSSAQRIGGFHRPEAGMDQWAEKYGVFHPDGKTPLAVHKNPLVRAIRGVETDEMEVFVRNDQKPDGAFISVSGRPLLQDGVSRGGVIVVRDITIQKRATEELEQTLGELRNQSELLETTFDSISDGIIVTGTSEDFLYVNPGARDILGIETVDVPDARLGEKWGTYYYLDRETPVVRDDLPILRAMSRGESTDEMDIFVRSLSKPGGVYVRVSARPLLDAKGGIRGGVAIFRDVTDQTVAEEALTRAFAQGRLEIVDTILHNIGNAIMSVTVGIDTLHQNLSNNYLLGLLQALANIVAEHRDDWTDYVRNDPQGQKVIPGMMTLAEDFSRQNRALIKTVERVRDRASHISDIVRTQKTLGGARVDRKTISLKDAIQTAAKVLQGSSSKRGITIDIDCQRAPQEIHIQESQLHQALINLIKNAFEAIDDLATSQGLRETPRVSIRAYAKEEFLCLDVTDNGIGIDKTDFKMIFAAGYTTKKSGSGLGLHSTANFVIGSGGQIQPLSDGIGLGTTMRVLLRLDSITPVAGRR